MSSESLTSSKGIIESWRYYVSKKQAEGWILTCPNQNYYVQTLKNPDTEAKIRRITYTDYAKVIKLLFKNATTYLIEGQPLSLQGNGVIKARRVERSESRLNLTNGTIVELGKKGIDNVPKQDIKYLYYNDFVTMHWTRPIFNAEKDFLRNYRFHIGRDNKGTGFKERFSNSNIENPNLKYNYDFYPTDKYIF